WDPKPDGPYPARGEFGAIATSVPGVRIGELLPLSARMVHKLALIRSLSHANANHVQASLPAMTGHAHLRSDESKGDFPPSPTDFPPFGAVLNHLRPAGKLPTWVQVGPLMRRNNGTVLHGQSPGFFGGKHSPLVIDQDLQARDVRVEAVSANAQVPLLRLQGRKELLQQVDGQRLQWEQNIDVQDLDAYQQKALNLLTSPAMAEFGRTQRVNKGGGRDHWRWVDSVGMAGGGTAPGVVYGASDKAAAYPTSHPHDPCDLAATVYHLLGVPAMTTVYDQTHRP